MSRVSDKRHPLRRLRNLAGLALFTFGMSTSGYSSAESTHQVLVPRAPIVKQDGSLTVISIDGENGIVYSSDPQNSGFEVYTGGKVLGCHLPAGPCGMRDNQPINVRPPQP